MHNKLLFSARRVFRAQIFSGYDLQVENGLLLLCSPTVTTAYGAPGAGNVAQLVEHSTENAGVVGSIPTITTESPSDCI
jgi:hypothetical protein